jgi:peptidoglycan/xylan/chitin deacetylase (PgdA/CDA1 family)
MEYFSTLCYHYIRPLNDLDPFKKLLGASEEEFYNHLEILSKNYEFITLNDAYDFLYHNKSKQTDKPGLLLTFDDGLSDHYLAAKILSEFNASGVFFIPTCILQNHEPANPTIIHYGIAKYGITNFLEEYHNILDEKNLNNKIYNISYEKGMDSGIDIIKKIKLNFKYLLNYLDGRSILLLIYQRLILKEYSNALEIMHLTEQQICKMKSMGHSFGTHTHTHISVSPTQLTNKQQELELVMPKQILENILDQSVISFSYPYGESKDRFKPNTIIDSLKIYKLIFTVEEKNNFTNTSPFSIGRYQPMSNVTSSTLLNKLTSISKNIVN